jgi:rSAM/selenodomain-associated transferase 1
VKRGLIIFAREPVPGKVKTRLAASIGNAAAAELYEAMLQGVLETSRKLENVASVVYWDCEENALPALAGKYRCRSRRQASGDLGQRLLRAFEEMFAEGYETCCIIGSDAPDLPLSFIQETYGLLEEQGPDVVFGPCRDGGYYLIGLQQPVPQLFADISWSGPAVLAQSLAAARESGLTSALLPEWQDIDTVEDLREYEQRNSLKRTKDTS